jgi:hypothetical protein
MSLVLDGTNGLSEVDGSAATPAIRGTDTNTGIFFPAADTIAFAEGGAEVARFDASGNFGLGVPPSAWTGNVRALQIGLSGIFAGHTSVNLGYFGANWYFDGGFNRYVNSAFANRFIANGTNGNFEWQTAPSGTAGNAISFTQAMTLDASGNLLVGTTSNIASGYRMSIAPASSQAGGIAWRNFDTNASNPFAVFLNSAGTVVGSIICSNTATAFNQSSDYRLKNTIAPMTGALAKVALLKPCTYKWNVDGSEGQGFIAHELQEVVPQCVTGEKDAVDAEGKPQYQGIDTSFLVATLTAAIQEQQALIDAQQAALQTLTAQVAALDARLISLEGTQP